MTSSGAASAVVRTRRVRLWLAVRMFFKVVPSALFIFDQRIKRWRTRNHVRGKGITGVSQLAPSLGKKKYGGANEGYF